ncbi:hypothetical protein [Anabaena azotica]|uniref:hypothetical protein n=1 Tax=Anabaena azotica TaxID=197653 RepID=UPI0039A3FF2C
MNLDHTDNFIIVSDSFEIKSHLIPLIAFKSQEQKEIAENYLIEEATDFFTNILKINYDCIQIPYPQLITKQDFKATDIEYFYENLFYDLGERDSNGKLKAKIKWGITFDEENTPIEVGRFNKQGNFVNIDNRRHRPRLSYRPKNRNLMLHRKYGTIDINGIPIFYYLHFTLQEILDAIKGELSI